MRTPNAAYNTTDISGTCENIIWEIALLNIIVTDAKYFGSDLIFRIFKQ